MKKKLIALVLTAAAVSVCFTVCEKVRKRKVKLQEKVAESNVISETSASLGIYVQDTDNDEI